MNDRVFFSLCALVAIGLIALALVWPQGLGARSPERFGRPLAQPAPLPPGTAPAAKQPATPAATLTP